MMRNTGKSWRFAEGIEELPNAALFVRDALGLLIQENPLVPPPLTGNIPKLDDKIDPNSLKIASKQWTSWWEAIVALEAKMQLGEIPNNHSNWRATLGRAHRQLVDPPDWSSLTDQPELRAGVRATFADGGRWFSNARQSLISPIRGSLVAWETIREVAVEVATELNVNAGAINGCVIVVLVESRWWRPFAPGVVLCSVTALEESDTARSILRDAFTSYVAN